MTNNKAVSKAVRALAKKAYPEYKGRKIRTEVRATYHVG